MTFLISDPFVPSELDDEIDKIDLSSEYVWVYSCKLSSCLDQDKSWNLRSNFLPQLQEREKHETWATTFVARRAMEINWCYVTDSYLSSRVILDFRSRMLTSRSETTTSKIDNGKIIKGKDILKQMKMRKISWCRQM